MAFIEGTGEQAYALARWILEQDPEMLYRVGFVVEDADAIGTDASEGDGDELPDDTIRVRLGRDWGSQPNLYIPPASAVSRGRARRARIVQHTPSVVG